MGVDLRIIKTKRKLKKSLISLLKKESIENISVSKICEVANVNRVTFYTHYQDKFALFSDYFNDISANIIKKANANATGDNQLEKTISFLSEIFNNTLDYYMEHFDIFKSIIYRDNAPLTDIIDKRVLTLLSKLLHEAFANQNTKYSIDFIAYFIAGGCNTLLYETMKSQNVNEIKQLKANSKNFISDFLKSNILVN